MEYDKVKPVAMNPFLVADKRHQQQQQQESGSESYLMGSVNDADVGRFAHGKKTTQNSLLFVSGPVLSRSNSSASARRISIQRDDYESERIESTSLMPSDANTSKSSISIRSTSPALSVPSIVSSTYTSPDQSPRIKPSKHVYLDTKPHGDSASKLKSSSTGVSGGIRSSASFSSVAELAKRFSENMDNSPSPNTTKAPSPVTSGTRVSEIQSKLKPKVGAGEHGTVSLRRSATFASARSLFDDDTTVHQSGLPPRPPSTTTGLLAPSQPTNKSPSRSLSLFDIVKNFDLKPDQETVVFVSPAKRRLQQTIKPESSAGSNGKLCGGDVYQSVSMEKMAVIHVESVTEDDATTTITTAVPVATTTVPVSSIVTKNHTDDVAKTEETAFSGKRSDSGAAFDSKIEQDVCMQHDQQHHQPGSTKLITVSHTLSKCVMVTKPNGLVCGVLNIDTKTKQQQNESGNELERVFARMQAKQEIGKTKKTEKILTSGVDKKVECVVEKDVDVGKNCNVDTESRSDDAQEIGHDSLDESKTEDNDDSEDGDSAASLSVQEPLPSTISTRIERVDELMPKIEIGSIWSDEDDGWLTNMITRSRLVYEQKDENNQPVYTKDTETKVEHVSASVDIESDEDDDDVTEDDESDYDDENDDESNYTEETNSIGSAAKNLLLIQDVLKEENDAGGDASRRVEKLVPPKNRPSIDRLHFEPFFEHQKLPEVQNKSKSVTFGVAWQGQMSSSRSIPRFDTPVFYEHRAIGQILIQITDIDGITGIDHERVADIEITQADRTMTSPPFIVPPGETGVSTDWEAPIAVVGQHPLKLVLRIRQVVEDTFAMSRSGSSKSLLKSSAWAIQDRILSKFSFKQQAQPQQSDSSSGTGRTSDGGLFTSFSMALPGRSDARNKLGFGRNLVASKVIEVGSGSMSIDEPMEWAKPFTNAVRETELEIRVEASTSLQAYASGSTYLSPIQQETGSMVATVRFRVAFVPASTCRELDLMPLNLLEVEHSLHTRDLHSKVWKQGYLYQQGGDTADWTRRFFKLVDDKLVGYHDTNRSHCVTIDLEHLEMVRYYACQPIDTGDHEQPPTLSELYQQQQQQKQCVEEMPVEIGTSMSPDVFVLEFRDGRSIALRLDLPVENGKCPYSGMDIEHMRNEWIDALEESHYLLNENPMPCWLQS